MSEINKFVFDDERSKHTFYSSTNEINEISIMEAVNACGAIEHYFWNTSKHLILINEGVVVATVHSITQSRLVIITLFS